MFIKLIPLISSLISIIYLANKMNLLLLALIAVTGAFAEDTMNKSDAKTIYDQRQTGKYNVHVNIKDVQLISLSDSISSLGDYGSYDYGDYGEGDEDYDNAHLTVNPIFAFLGSKPSTTTSKPSTTSPIYFTTTEKHKKTSTTQQVNGNANAIEESTTDKDVKESTTTLTTTATKQELETTVKPALKPLKVDESIDYEEIPVEVQYYRTNPKLQSVIKNNNRRRHPLKRIRPSVQILDGRKNNNVQIIETDQHQPIVKICARGEFRDNYGRCRVKAQKKNRIPGL
jgi:hypothetical protein